MVGLADGLALGLRGLGVGLWVGCAAGVGRVRVLACACLVVGWRADDPGGLGLVRIVSERWMFEF